MHRPALHAVWLPGLIEMLLRRHLVGMLLAIVEQGRVGGSFLCARGRVDDQVLLRRWRFDCHVVHPC